jgi:hypothetical protein
MPANNGRSPARRNTSAGALSSPSASPDTSAVEEGTTTLGAASSTQPEAELTPEQKRIKDLEDQLARVQGAKDPDTEYDKVANPGNEKNILIHFVRDGFCELGTVWYKGQELELEPGTAQYDSAKTWANLESSEQEEFYGDVYFRKGEWKGKNYEEEAAAKAERRRNRAAPRLNS